jgi:hypothetical protein
VKRHLKWITNSVTNTRGAGYDHTKHACNLEIQDLREVSYEVHVAFHARIIVHESTHGLIEARGTPYTQTNRNRIERLCATEENRFARRLSAYDPERYPARLLQLDFNQEHWQEEWSMTRGQWLRALIGRWLNDAKAEPSAPPNGGPVEPFGNLGVRGGPPSVS